jgi:hypothetical protein
MEVSDYPRPKKRRSSIQTPMTGPMTGLRTKVGC